MAFYPGIRRRRSHDPTYTRRVRGAPYVVVYRVRPGVIDILAVYHHAQDR
ncbi:MAG: type II toxin-antitoxin system RelE/ParE family toxin [Alphaproteobacteria bacterium]|nr:type II toxin-antitoxin system RelE/ParE family toxin [Alphaproteobacteria bacterium]